MQTTVTCNSEIKIQKLPQFVLLNLSRMQDYAILLLHKLTANLNENNLIVFILTIICLFNFTLTTAALSFKSQSPLFHDCSLTTWCYSYNLTCFLCRITARKMLNCVCDPVYSWPGCISWVICMCPYSSLQRLTVFSMGISEWPPPRTLNAAWSSVCHGRSVTPNIRNLYVFLS